MKTKVSMTHKKILLLISFVAMPFASNAQSTSTPAQGVGSALPPVAVTPNAPSGNISDQANQAQSSNNLATQAAGAAQGLSSGIAAKNCGDGDDNLCIAGIAGVGISILMGQNSSGAATGAAATQAQVTTDGATGANQPVVTPPTTVAAALAPLAAQGGELQSRYRHGDTAQWPVFEYGRLIQRRSCGSRSITSPS